MLEALTFSLISLFFYVYILVSSIGFGTSVLILFPSLTKNDKFAHSFLSPVWETSHIFLVLSFLALVVFFPTAMQSFNTLLPFIFLLVSLLAIRVMCTLFLRYISNNSVFVKLILCIASLGAPIILAQVLGYMLSNTTSPGALITIVTSILAAVLVLSLSLTFFRTLTRKTDLKMLDNLITISLTLLVISITTLQLSLLYTIPYLFEDSAQTTLGTSFLMGALVVLFVTLRMKKPLALFIGTCVLVGSICAYLSILLFPYLVFPTVMIYSNFTNSSLSAWLLSSFGLLFVILLPSLFLLYKFFLNIHRPRS